MKRLAKNDGQTDLQLSEKFTLWRFEPSIVSNLSDPTWSVPPHTCATQCQHLQNSENGAVDYIILYRNTHNNEQTAAFAVLAGRLALRVLLHRWSSSSSAEATARYPVTSETLTLFNHSIIFQQVADAGDVTSSDLFSPNSNPLLLSSRTDVKW